MQILLLRLSLARWDYDPRYVKMQLLRNYKNPTGACLWLMGACLGLNIRRPLKARGESTDNLFCQERKLETHPCYAFPWLCNSAMPTGCGAGSVREVERLEDALSQAEAGRISTEAALAHTSAAQEGQVRTAQLALQTATRDLMDCQARLADLEATNTLLIQEQQVRSLADSIAPLLPTTEVQ